MVAYIFCHLDNYYNHIGNRHKKYKNGTKRKAKYRNKIYILNSLH